MRPTFTEEQRGWCWSRCDGWCQHTY